MVLRPAVLDPSKRFEIRSDRSRIAKSGTNRIIRRSSGSQPGHDERLAAAESFVHLAAGELKKSISSFCINIFKYQSRLVRCRLRIQDGKSVP